MEYPKTWILIADASKARIFSIIKAKFIQTNGASGMELIDESIHNASRVKNAELVTDRPGDFNNGAYVEHSTAKQQEANHYAQSLMQFLKGKYQEHAFRDCILVAPPSFLGLLQKHADSQFESAISQKIEKDYTHQNGNELKQLLLSHF